MASTWWARLRQGWRSVLLVAGVTALAGGLALTAVAGARRTATVGDRLGAEAREPDVMIDAAAVDPAQWDRIEQLPAVEASGRAAYAFAGPLADPERGYPFFMSTDGSMGRDVFRGHLLEGRRADPEAVEEVVLEEHIAERLDVEVGDALPIGSISPETAEVLLQGGEIVPDGPEVDLEVVGIVRMPNTIADDETELAGTILSPAFADRYQDEVGHTDGLIFLRLHDGADGIADLTEQLEAAFPPDEGPAPLIDAGAISLPLEDTLIVIAQGLLAFAAVATLFGLAAVGQVIATTVARRRPEQLTLAGLGMSRRGRFADAWLPLTVAALVGTGGAVALSVAGSAAMPIGLAGRVEPDPGLDLDLLVLGGGGIVLLVVVAAMGGASAWRVARVRPADLLAQAGTPRRRLLPWVVARSSPTATVGLELVDLTGRGPAATAVRTALLGVLVACTGLAAVAVVGASTTRLIDTPARYGWTWDVAIVDRDQPAAEALAEQGVVDAVAVGVVNQAITLEGGDAVAGMAITPVAGTLDPTIIAGRAPVSDDEVALAADTSDELGAPDELVALDREGEPQAFAVVGTTVIPSLEAPEPLAAGALFTPGGLERLGAAEVDPSTAAATGALVRFGPDVEVDEGIEALGLSEGDVVRPTTPTEVARVQEVNGVPRLVAMLLAGLGLLAVGHALWRTVRSRRQHLAILQAIGFDRGQVRRAMAWQAAAITVVGVVVGIPLGVVAGRGLWALLAGELGVADDALVPLVVVAVALVPILLALLAGAAMGALASRQAPAGVLRTE